MVMTMTRLRSSQSGGCRRYRHKNCGLFPFLLRGGKLPTDAGSWCAVPRFRRQQ